MVYQCSASDSNTMNYPHPQHFAPWQRRSLVQEPALNPVHSDNSAHPILETPYPSKHSFKIHKYWHVWTFHEMVKRQTNTSLGRLGWLGLRTCRKSCKSSWAFKQCKGGKSKRCNSETLDNCTNAMLLEDFWQSKWLETLASCEFARLKASRSPLVSKKTTPLLF